MPICESTKCNAPVLYLKRLTASGRQKLVIVNAEPEKRWVELEGKAVLLETYDEHKKTCLEEKKEDPHGNPAP